MSGIAVRLLAAAYNFPGLQQIALVRRTYWDGNEIKSEGRYFLTSLPKNRLSAKRFLAKVTSHWEVENSLHNMKDKHWQEDKQYTLRVTLGCMQSALRNLSLNILRSLEVPGMSPKASISKKALSLLAQPLEAIKWLAGL